MSTAPFGLRWTEQLDDSGQGAPWGSVNWMGGCQPAKCYNPACDRAIESSIKQISHSASSIPSVTMGSDPVERNFTGGWSPIDAGRREVEGCRRSGRRKSNWVRQEPRQEPNQLVTAKGNTLFYFSRPLIQRPAESKTQARYVNRTCSDLDDQQHRNSFRQDPGCQWYQNHRRAPGR